MTAPPTPGTSRARLAVAVTLLAAVAAVWALRTGESLRVDPDTSVFSLEKRGIRYEFHAVSGVESLWDVSMPAADRRNLLRSRPDDAARLRTRMLELLKVQDLRTLRERHKETIEDLRKLGYF